MRDTVRFGDGDAEHFQLAMNPGRAPQGISRGHSLYQLAEFCGGAGTTSTTATRLRQSRPESSEPFALPSNDRVWLDIHQGMSPVGPQAAEGNPKHPVNARQKRTLLLSLKCRYL